MSSHSTKIPTSTCLRRRYDMADFVVYALSGDDLFLNKAIELGDDFARLQLEIGRVQRRQLKKEFHGKSDLGAAQQR